jgi:YidC/Oxa1 family membrane protein insertase
MNEMKRLQPQIDAIHQQFLEDDVQENKEIMELYKRENVTAPSGCLPVLLQLVVLYLIYKVLMVTIELRHAPFLGWKDLSAPDPTNVFNLFGLLPFDPMELPLLGRYLYIGILPLILAATVWMLQQRISPVLFGPFQRKVFIAFPLLVIWSFRNYPVGGVIFFTWYCLLSIAHQWLLMGRSGVVGDISEYSAKVLPFGKAQPIIFLVMLAPVVQMLLLLVFWRRTEPSSIVKIVNKDAANKRRSLANVANWFRKITTKTNTGTHAKLGVLHEDDAEKLNWYRRAAEEGDPDAQSTLGLMYFTGRGVLQDYAEAHKWFNLAASRYSTSDIRSLDQAIRDRENVAAKMTPEQIAEAQKLARNGSQSVTGSSIMSASESSLVVAVAAVAVAAAAVWAWGVERPQMLACA